MNDLISKHAAIEALKDHFTDEDPFPMIEDGAYWDHKAVIEVIENLPPTKPKKGKWEYKSAYKGAKFGFYICSVCKTPYWQNDYNYCPHCGAFMRGEDHE